MSFPARPRFDIGTDFFPSPEIEIADAEIRVSRQLDRLAESGQKLLIDVVEDSRQGVEPLLSWLNCGDSTLIGVGRPRTGNTREDAVTTKR